MKIIWPSNITAVLASSQAAGYEDDMVLNDWPGSRWKANATTAQTLTVTVAAPAAIYLGYTNYAGPLTYTTKTGGGATVATGSLTAIPGGGLYHYWYEPPAPGTIASVVFSFGAVASAVQVGIVRAGAKNDFGDPEYDLSDAPMSRDIVTETSNGSRYVKHRDAVGAYAGEVKVPLVSGRCPLVALGMTIGARPFASYVRPGIYLFASFDGIPDGEQVSSLYSRTSFSVVEA